MVSGQRSGHEKINPSLELDLPITGRSKVTAGQQEGVFLEKHRISRGEGDQESAPDELNWNIWEGEPRNLHLQLTSVLVLTLAKILELLGSPKGPEP